MRVDAQAERPEAIIQIGFPDGLVPLHPGGAPDVVHQQVQDALFRFNPSYQRANLFRHQMIHLNRDASASGSIDECCRLFDRLGPVHFRPLRSGGSAGDVDGGSRGT
jgi:hypothetical protein